MQEVFILYYKYFLQTSRPRGAKLWPKFQILTVLIGSVFPHFCVDKGDIWTGWGADYRRMVI